MRHIILIGFKNVGKSALGKQLATRLNMELADLDECINKDYASAHGLKRISSREIVNKLGLEAFRDLELETFRRLLNEKANPAVITMGGGAPMNPDVRELMSGHVLVHVTAPKSIVYERIMVHGRPSFFDKGTDAFDAFEALWEQRTPVFTELADISVSNTGKVSDMVDEIVATLAH